MSRASKILESLSKKTKKFNESWTKKSVENLRDRIFSDLKLVVEDEYEKRKDNSRLHPQDILAAAEQRANAALEVVYKLENLVSRVEHLSKKGDIELDDLDFEIDAYTYTKALDKFAKSKDSVYSIKLFPTVEQVLK